MPKRRKIQTACMLALALCYVPVLGLHAREALLRGLAQPVFFVSNPPGGDPHPRVQGFRLEQHGGSDALRIGDRLLQIGDTDTRGLGHIGVDALTIREGNARGFVPVVVERDGRRFAARVDLAPLALPWARIPVLFLVFLVATAVLLRAPSGAAPGLFFVAWLLVDFQQTPFHGPSQLQTYASKTIFYVLGPVAPPLVLWWLSKFPPEAPPPGRWASVLPVILGLAFAGLRASYFLGGPLPAAHVPRGVQLVDAAFIIAILAMLLLNYRRSDPAGRRRVKWLLVGTYLGFLPFALVHLLPLPAALYVRLLYLATPPMVALPLGLLVAVTRQNLFDVNRLVSATASYSLVVAALLSGALILLPRVAALGQELLSLDPALGQGILTVALAMAVVPAQRLVQPRIDRTFFPERFVVESEMPRLLTGIAGCESRDELVAQVGSELAALLPVRSCVIQARRNGGFAPLFIHGVQAPEGLDEDSPLVAVLGRRKEPVVDGPTAGGRGSGLSPVGRAVLQEMDVALVAPVRVEDRLEALICLGEKRSGDLFTASELAWIAALADRMGAELLRMRASAESERRRELQDAYRAWVPGSLAEQIERGDALEEGERDVTVLFVDIRGYTSFAELRETSEVFSVVTRYANEVSRAIEGRGGTVVEFSGDGLMAVFGEPRPLTSKELAAVAAAEDILGAMLSISSEAGSRLQVGIGIASGPTFVGSIRASNRRIWTALGATTNLAARLQMLCRELGAAALIDEATWLGAGEHAARFERRADVAIRGFSSARVVYARPLA